MRFTPPIVALVVAACPIFVSAAPTLFSRQNAADSDILVIKFAGLLEQLERDFYKEALSKFKEADFAAAGFPASQVAVEQFSVIQEDEATHATALEGVLKSLNQEPITSCKFNFNSVLQDVATMASVARFVELVGVGAYLGAAPLLKDPTLLVTAGSILTVEARHQTILNVLSSNGTAIPSAFDVALTPSEVASLASPLFNGPCDLGVPVNPPLTITTNATLLPGTKLEFSAPTLNDTNQDGAFCQMLLGGQTSSTPLPLKDCVIPQGTNGPVFIWLTSDNQPLLNDVKNRATSQLIAGPTIAFVDTKPQLLNQLARENPSNPTPITVTSTSTISPAEALSLSPSATPPPALEVNNPGSSSTWTPCSTSTTTSDGSGPTGITLVAADYPAADPPAAALPAADPPAAAPPSSPY